MKIKTFSRSEIENINKVYPDISNISVSLISIGNPDEKTAELNEELFNDILRLNFFDYDPTYSGDQNEKEENSMERSQAKQIVEFVENHNSEYFFIHCQMGVSRSCGIAYALEKYYNNGEIRPHWQNYNRHVFKLVNEELNGVKRDSKYFQQAFKDQNG